MPDLIPAVPGWYVDTDGALDPVIAWTRAINSEGDDTLLPVVPDGRGLTPWLVSEGFLKEFNGQIVYLPKHDPGTGSEAS